MRQKKERERDYCREKQSRDEELPVAHLNLWMNLNILILSSKVKVGRSRSDCVT